MEKKNKLFLAFSFVLAACSLSVFAKDPEVIPMPKRNEVVIIARAIVSNPIDIDSRRKGFKIEEGSENDVKTIKNFVLVDGSGLSSTSYSADDLGQPTFGYAKVNQKTHTVIVKSFKCIMFGKYAFYLPIFAEVTVPEGEQFVYIGSFQYTLDYALRITDARRFDEYDNACKWVKEAFGKDDIEVVRGELAPIEDKK